MADAPDPGSKSLSEMTPPPSPANVSDVPAALVPEAAPHASQMVQSPPLQEVADGWDKAIQDLNKKKKGSADNSDPRNAGSSSGNDSVVATEVCVKL